MTKTELDEMLAFYPSPCSINETQGFFLPTDYCYGGALLLYRGADPENSWNRFPSTRQLADALLRENPSLNKERADELAALIIELNDADELSRARALLIHALGLEDED